MHGMLVCKRQSDCCSNAGPEEAHNSHTSWGCMHGRLECEWLGTCCADVGGDNAHNRHKAAGVSGKGAPAGCTHRAMHRRTGMTPPPGQHRRPLSQCSLNRNLSVPAWTGIFLCHQLQHSAVRVGKPSIRAGAPAGRCGRCLRPETRTWCHAPGS